MKIRLFIGALLLSAAIAGHVEAVETVETVESPDASTDPSIADYEGTDIDLRDGWESARACLTNGIETECWDSEAEMLLALAAAGNSPQLAPTAQPPGSALKRQSTCSTFLRLYSGANYTGAVLAIATRFSFLNLSSYGFNNSTSSYRVGACPVALYDGNVGAPPLYPGATHEWAWGPSMLSGWDNRISSVYQG